MSRRLVGGLSVVAALGLLVLYGSLQAQIDDARYAAKEAADQADEVRLEIETVRSEVDDLTYRKDGYGY